MICASVLILSGCRLPNDGLVSRVALTQTPASPLPPLQTPSSPTALRVLSLTSASAVLAWDGPADAAGGITFRISEVIGSNFSVIAEGLTASSYSLIALTPAVSRSFVVQSVAQANTQQAVSLYSAPVVVTPPLPIPGVPSGVVASAITSSAFRISWAAVSGAVNYKISEAATKFSEMTVTTLNADFAGLSPSTGYSVRVRACNATGVCSSNSGNLAVMTLAAPAPATPTNLAASAITQTSFSLSWTTVAGAASYKVSEATAKFSELTSTTPTVSVSNLSAGMSYSVRVRACNSAGACSANTANLGVNTLAAPAPAVPAGLASSAITQNSFTLSWNGVSGAASYRVSEAAAKFPETSTTEIGKVITGLNASTAHAVRVRACNSAGLCSSNSTDLSVRTLDPPAPPVPTGLALSAITQTSATLAWAAVSGAASYKVSEATAKFPETSVTTPSRNLASLTANTTYQLQVRSCNSATICSTAASITLLTLPTPAPSPSPSPVPSPSPSPSSVPAVITPAGTFSDSFPSDATDIKRTIPLRVFIAKNPDQITIQLQNVATVTRTGPVQVFRKIKGTTDWGASIGSIATTANSLTFSASRGVHYEIKVTGPLSSSSGPTLNNGLGYTSAGIEVDSPDYRGKILLVIDNQTAPLIVNELNTFRSTLIADGWIPIDVLVNRTDAVSVVKSAIQSAYNTDTANVKSAFLIGRVPVAYSGNGAPDGHEDHVGVWPTDQYFADFSVWPSGSGNITHTGYRNRASTSISRFSPNITPSELELEIGRLDMQALETDLNGVATFSEGEVALLKSYLIRASDYKKGAVAVSSNRAIINNTLYWALDNGIQGVFKSFSSHVGIENIEFTSSGSNYFIQEIGTTAKPVAQWVYGGGGSYFGMLGSNIDINQISQSSYAHRGIFFRSFGSYFGDFDTRSNILRAMIAKGHGLTSSYEANPVYTHFMNLGESMGYSMRRSINSMAAQNCNVTSNQECIAEYSTAAIKVGTSITSTVHWDAAYGYWGGAYMGVVTNLMGDPTLRMSPVKIPANAASTANASGKLVVSWSAPSETSVVGYNVYKINYSGSQVTGYTKLNSTPIPGTSYVSNLNYLAGEKFLVKTVKLQSNPSGDYLNHSVGALVTNN